MSEIGGFGKLLAMAKAYVDPNVEDIKMQIPQQQIGVSDRFHQIVQSREFLKLLRATSDKRRIIGNNTLPYGYAGDDDPEYNLNRAEQQSLIDLLLEMLEDD